MAIARGEHKPARGEPTVWLTSIESFAKVLSGRNRELPALIAREKPDSLTAPAALAGRNKSNLSWTLKTMSRCRLVELKDGDCGTLVPRVPTGTGRRRTSPNGLPTGTTGWRSGGGSGRRPFGRSRCRWSTEENARVVRESFRPGKLVGEVAPRYGVSRWQLSTWRSLARAGKLAVPRMERSGYSSRANTSCSTSGPPPGSRR